MTDERAIEILSPEHREHYESIEPVNEACRIGIAAIKRVKELERENAELKQRDVRCASSVDEMIASCDKCGLLECYGCEHSYTAVQEVKKLQVENVALRERLDKAIILPCKLGDKLYFVNEYLATPKIQEHYITAIEIFPSYVKLYVEDGGYFILDGDNVYFNREAAETRLKELQGEYGKC